MASGKKGKTKWKPVALNNIVDATAPVKSWADESDEIDTFADYGRKPAEKVVLPTAPRAARDIDNDLAIPKEPPYQAYISNLPYDVTEEELVNFFADFRLKNVRLPKEERMSSDRGKIKGFGYIEFEDRSEFIEALRLGDATLKGRRMKIEVAQEHDTNQGNRGRMMRDRGDFDRSTDWRAGPRSDDRDGFRRNNRRDFGGSGFSRRDNEGGGFSDRSWDQKGSDRGGGFRDRDGDRGGGFRDRDGGGGFRERDSERSWMRDRDSDRDRGFRDRDDRERSDFPSERSWRKEPDRDRDQPQESREPKTRPKLMLQPRTKPSEEKEIGDKTDELDKKKEIFGGAKPVDTAAREREIEERLSKQKEDRFEDSRSKPLKDTIEKVQTESDSPVANDSAQSQSSNLEPAPLPKDNPWSRRPPQEKNGRLSPQEDSERNKPLREDVSPTRESINEDSSSNDNQRKYQPPSRRQPASDQRRPRSKEDRGRGSGVQKGGERGPSKSADVKSSGPPKTRDSRRDVDDVLKMPKLQEQKAPNFAVSNKFAFLDDSNENSAD